ncbi:MAG TPA: hypothetical protein VN641_18700 [Urbifossiella sp.]|nr:hypothetical protein [Urbifossiella sp.]
MDFAALIARLQAEAKQRLAKAASHLANQLKEVLSVPAPRVKKRGRQARAATPAIPGAPPRKLTGRLRASIAWVVSADGMTATVGTNVIYGAVHEHGLHPWLMVTFQRERAAIDAILNGGGA